VQHSKTGRRVGSKHTAHARFDALLEIVFSTFRECMSFYTARVKSRLVAMSAECPVCPKADTAGRFMSTHSLRSIMDEASGRLLSVAPVAS